MVGCASTQQQLQPDNFANVGWEPTTVEFEQKLSDELLPEVQKDFPTAKDLGVQEFLAKVGNKLLSADVYNQPAPYRWNFTAFESSGIQSFSLPAGEIFISTGLLASVGSEAELAGVLAHEISHVLLKHTTRRIQEMRRLNKNWSMVGGGIMGGLMGYGMGKTSEDPSNGQMKWAFLTPTPEQENEADMPGLSIAIKAGYDSKHVGQHFQKMAKDANGKAKPGFEARFELMNKFCTDSGDKRVKGLVSSSGFERVKAKAKAATTKSKG